MSGRKLVDAVKEKVRGFDEYEIWPAIGGFILNAAGTVEVSSESLKETVILDDEGDQLVLPPLGDVLVTAKGTVVNEDAKPPASGSPFLSTALDPIDIV